MDRALKERIIGAVVLVVFVVLVVPIFLDGPPPEDEIRTQTVVLPGQSEQKMQTQVLNRDRETPVPEAVQVAQKEPEAEEPEPTKDTKPASTEAAEPVPEPEPEIVSVEEGAKDEPEAQEPDGVATSATGMWAVQLGSFSDEVNAEKLAAELRKQGFFAVLSKLDTDKGQLHRVRIGPQADRAAAEAVVKKLSSAGYKGQVVPHP